MTDDSMPREVWVWFETAAATRYVIASSVEADKQLRADLIREWDSLIGSDEVIVAKMVAYLRSQP